MFWWSSIPHLAVATGSADLWTRKPAHIVEYGILCVLIYRLLFHKGRLSNPLTWQNQTAVMAVVLAVLYGVSDEIHQHFVPSRAGKVSDVGFDLIGALLGLVILRWYLWRQRKVVR